MNCRLFDGDEERSIVGSLYDCCAGASKTGIAFNGEMFRPMIRDCEEEIDIFVGQLERSCLATLGSFLYFFFNILKRD